MFMFKIGHSKQTIKILNTHKIMINVLYVRIIYYDILTIYLLKLSETFLIEIVGHFDRIAILKCVQDQILFVLI